MPAITDRSTKEPLLKTKRLGHGTLECVDIAKTRRFYEEVLGFDVIQTSHRSLMIRGGTDHTYAVVELGKENEMSLLNHNGIEVESTADVDAAFETLTAIADEYGIKKIQRPHHSHGDYSFYFMDLDGNWWEIVAVRPGGYVADFDERDQGWDLTGRHDFDDVTGNVNYIHTHEPEFRARLQQEGS